eukprot:jgi/Mesvir1/14564/Mv05246-RA.1
MDYPTYYQYVNDFKGMTPTIDGRTGLCYFNVKPDPRAPVIDSTWRGGAHWVGFDFVENRDNYKVIGLVSPSFLGGEQNPGECVVLCSEQMEIGGEGIPLYEFSPNAHSFYNLKDPYLFRHGGQLVIGLVHIDREAEDTDNYKPVGSFRSFVCILRFEKVRGFDSCKCHHK